MSRLNIALVALIVVLLTASVVLSSWTAFAGNVLVVVAWSYLYTLNRFKPEHEPLPDAVQIQAEIEALRAEHKTDIERLRGMLEIRQQRFGMRE